MMDENYQAYLSKITEAHERSGLSSIEVARECDFDPWHVERILRGARRPQRDLIIALGLAYRLAMVDVDEILLLAGLPPIGRSVWWKYRQNNRQSNVLDE